MIKLVHCNKCNETTEHFEERGTKCGNCREVLKYKCQKCEQLFRTISSLNKHIRRLCRVKFKKNRKYSCDYCEYTSNIKKIITRHIKICVRQKNLTSSFMLYCNQCKYHTLEKSNLIRHIELKHSSLTNKSYKCDKCEKIYSSQMTLCQHSKICGLSKDFRYSVARFSCDHCNYKSDKKPSLTIHIRAKHLPPDPNLYKCKKCDRSYANRSNLNRHSKVCGLSKNLLSSLMYSCDDCEYKTIEKANLAKHIKYKHLPRDESNYCNRCGKSIADLRLHLKTCNLSKNSKNSLMRLACDNCNYKCMSKNSMRVHMDTKHLPRDFIPKKCTKCEKIFFHTVTLLKHSKVCGLPKTSLNLLMHFCDLCKYKTLYKPHLLRHIKYKHLPRDKSDECRKCGKSFVNLSQHFRICGLTADSYRALRRFTCDYCNFKSLYKKGMAQHIQTKHLRQKYFSKNSSKCGKKFMAKYFLESRVKNGGVIHFSCNHCLYKTTRKMELRKHIAAHHLP